MAMQTVQVLRELNLRPTRSIRVIAWMSEEFGGIGGNAYAEDHRAEIANHFAAIESDHGAGHPLGFSIKARQTVRPMLEPVSLVLQSSQTPASADSPRRLKQISLRWQMPEFRVSVFGKMGAHISTTTIRLPIRWIRSFQKNWRRTLRLWQCLRIRLRIYRNRFRIDD